MHDYLLHIQQQVLCYVQGRGLHIHGRNWKINTHKKIEKYINLTPPLRQIIKIFYIHALEVLDQ